MSEGALRFYFDFISPYAYLAWTQIEAMAARHGREVVPVPVLFAALLNDNGQKGPAEIPRKKAYMMTDVIRSAARLGVAFGPPPSHPFNPLLALRVASLPMTNETRRAIVSGLFGEIWGGTGRGVTEPAVVGEVVQAAGLDPVAALAAVGEGATKERLKQQTEEALALGAFGVPTIAVDGQLFWGLDALENLAPFLAGKDGLDAETFARWAKIPASASR